MILSEALLLASLIASPAATIPSVLDPPNVNGIPSLWADTENDNFYPRRPDDDLTFAFSLGIKLPDNLIFLADDYALTEKNTTKTRLDEVSFSLGYIFSYKDFWITPTIGYRLQGNYGNANIQSETHSIIEPHATPINSEYQRVSNVFTIGLSSEYRKELFRFLYDDAQFSYGYYTRAMGLITNKSELDAAYQFTIYGEQIGWYSYYVGYRAELRGGKTGNTTEDQVARKEKGNYFIIGTSIYDVLYIDIAHSVRFSYGQIGIMERF